MSTSTSPGHPAAYRWDPADYHNHSAAQQVWARELIAKLALRSDDCVLDIGCGDGKVTIEIAGQVPGGFVVGVDNSADMIAFARRTFPPAEYSRVRFDVVDARALPFTDEFDVVFSNAAMHWIVDHRPVLVGIARSLRPGGRVLLQMAGRGNAAGILEVLPQVIDESLWRDAFDGFAFPYGFHGPEDYRVWLDEAGLTPVRVELIPKDMRHASRDAMAGWVRTTWLPYLQPVPESLRDAFVAAVVDRYLERCPADTNGTVHVGMIRLEVEARKR